MPVAPRLAPAQRRRTQGREAPLLAEQSPMPRLQCARYASPSLCLLLTGALSVQPAVGLSRWPLAPTRGLHTISPARSPVDARVFAIPSQAAGLTENSVPPSISGCPRRFET